MRILILTTWIPHPPQSGGRIRTWEIARRLARHHEVVFAIHTRSADDLEALDVLRRHGFGVIAGPVNSALRAAGVALLETLRGGPPLTGFRRSRSLETELVRRLLAEPFDVIQVEQAALAGYLFLLPRHPCTVVVATLPDILSETCARIAAIEPALSRRLWFQINAAGFRRIERRLLPCFDICITMSERDRAALLGLLPVERTAVLPNCVDTLANPLLPEPCNSVPVLLFIGNMQYPPNADAARWLLRDILPRIRQVHPKTRLLLVGDHPSPDLATLAGPGVTITGAVADVAPYYQQADIAIAPLRAGGGTRLKILEAMARGRPVVSTSLGAEGLDVTHGRDLLLADTPKELAAAVLTLFGKPTLRAEIRAHARTLVESRYNWDRCVREHLELYERLTEARRLKGPSVPTLP